MSTVFKPFAAAGSTGNNSHVLVGVGACDAAAVQFVVEVAGGTPTVTWKVQGSLDGGANWYDVQYVTDATNTSSHAALTATGTGAQVIFLDSGNQSRFYTCYRLVTSANTNITYRAELSYQERRG